MTKIERVLMELNELYDFYQKLQRQRQPDPEHDQRDRGQRMERGAGISSLESSPPKRRSNDKAIFRR